MRLDCSTQQETEIESYGDFEFTLRKIEVEQLGYSVDTAVYSLLYGRQKRYGGSASDFDIDYKKYPQYKNAKEAFHEINVEINCTEE